MAIDSGARSMVANSVRCGVVFSITFLITVLVWINSSRNSAGGKRPATVENEYRGVCINEGEVSNAVRDLASDNWERIASAREILINKSDQSSTCRATVISALMSAMDKPQLNFEQDKTSYHLWLYGADLLADLKAIEAIDLLISHLQLTAIFYSSSNSQAPALRGLVRMGPVAIPRLAEVLKRESDPIQRLWLVNCIATIGGDSAVKSVREALNLQSDECAFRLMGMTIAPSDEEVEVNDPAKLLSAFRCDR